MFGFETHASELVCVAIGANLLFPAAPSLLARFLSGIETEPEKALGSVLAPSQKAEPHDIAEIADAGKRVAEIRSRCLRVGFAASVVDLVAAVLGILLLWTGLVDGIGAWSILLFAPCVYAIVAAAIRYRPCRREYDATVKRIGERIRVRAEDARSRARFEASVKAVEKLSGQG